MSMPDATMPPPAWYPDAEIPGGERWWDGFGWTDYRRAAPQLTAPAPVGYPGCATPGLAPFPGSNANVPLWAPLYGASFAQALRRFWKKGLDFSGRASRSEFWLAYLGYALIIFGSYLVMMVVAGVAAVVVADSNGVGIALGVFGLLWLIGLLVMMVPYIALTIRRLHDANYPGTYYLFAFIPFVGGILLLVFLTMESRPEGARFDLPRD